MPRFMRPPMPRRADRLVIIGDRPVEAPRTVGGLPRSSGPDVSRTALSSGITAAALVQPRIVPEASQSQSPWPARPRKCEGPFPVSTTRSPTLRTAPGLITAFVPIAGAVACPRSKSGAKAVARTALIGMVLTCCKVQESMATPRSGATRSDWPQRLLRQCGSPNVSTIHPLGNLIKLTGPFRTLEQEFRVILPEELAQPGSTHLCCFSLKIQSHDIATASIFFRINESTFTQLSLPTQCLHPGVSGQLVDAVGVRKSPDRPRHWTSKRTVRWTASARRFVVTRRELIANPDRASNARSSSSEGPSSPTTTLRQALWTCGKCDSSHLKPQRMSRARTAPPYPVRAGRRRGRGR